MKGDNPKSVVITGSNISTTYVDYVENHIIKGEDLKPTIKSKPFSKFRKTDNRNYRK